jgi:hypothetical protein
MTGIQSMQACFRLMKLLRDVNGKKDGIIRLDIPGGKKHKRKKQEIQDILTILSSVEIEEVEEPLYDLKGNFK